jgi:hypothetical protein
MAINSSLEALLPISSKEKNILLFKSLFEKIEENNKEKEELQKKINEVLSDIINNDKKIYNLMKKFIYNYQNNLKNLIFNTLINKEVNENVIGNNKDFFWIFKISNEDSGFSKKYIPEKNLLQLKFNFRVFYYYYYPFILDKKIISNNFNYNEGNIIIILNISKNGNFSINVHELQQNINKIISDLNDIYNNITEIIDYKKEIIEKNLIKKFLFGKNKKILQLNKEINFYNQLILEIIKIKAYISEIISKILDVKGEFFSGNIFNQEQ